MWSWMLLPSNETRRGVSTFAVAPLFVISTMAVACAQKSSALKIWKDSTQTLHFCILRHCCLATHTRLVGIPLSKKGPMAFLSPTSREKLRCRS